MPALSVVALCRREYSFAASLEEASAELQNWRSIHSPLRLSSCTSESARSILNTGAFEPLAPSTARSVAAVNRAIRAAKSTMINIGFFISLY